MDRGFRYFLAGIVVIALGYAALSVWPILAVDQAQPVSQPAPVVQNPQPAPPGTSAPVQNQSGTAQPAGQQPAQGTTAPPPAPGAAQAAPPAPHHANRRVYSPPPTRRPRYISRPRPEPESDGPPPVNWKYAKRSVELYLEPQGMPHSPTCLNNAPLVVVEGSRLEPLEYQNEWVMVRSPGQTLGWIMEDDLSDRPPAVRP